MSYYKGYIAAILKYAGDIPYPYRNPPEKDKAQEILSKDLVDKTWDTFNTKEKGENEESMYGTV